MARQVVLFETLNKWFGCCCSGGGSGGSDGRVRVCLHDFCGESCRAVKITDLQVLALLSCCSPCPTRHLTLLYLADTSSAVHYTSNI